MTEIYVVIPAHRPALDHLRGALETLRHPADMTVVVTNGPDPIREEELPDGIVLITDPASDINISRWWNIGLSWIDSVEPDPYHVLVMNADARIGPDGVAMLSYELSRSPAVMIGPHRSSGSYFETRAEPMGLHLRLPGYCFMLDSTAGLRADERFRWWCGDDDLEWQARQAGGTLLIGPVRFKHLGDGAPKGKLRDIARDDLWRFQDKWSVRPW